MTVARGSLRSRAIRAGVRRFGLSSMALTSALADPRERDRLHARVPVLVEEPQVRDARLLESGACAQSGRSESSRTVGTVSRYTRSAQTQL